MDPEQANHEYDSLRSEIVAYKEQRFQAMGLTVAAATALFTPGFATHSPELFLCIYIVLFPVSLHRALSEAHSLSLAAYIRIFYEGNRRGWETRVARYRKLHGHRSGALSYGMLFAGLAAAGSFFAFVFLSGLAKVIPIILFICWSAWHWGTYWRIVKRYRDGDSDEVERWIAVQRLEE